MSTRACADARPLRSESAALLCEVHSDASSQARAALYSVARVGLCLSDGQQSKGTLLLRDAAVRRRGHPTVERALRSQPGDAQHKANIIISVCTSGGALSSGAARRRGHPVIGTLARAAAARRARVTSRWSCPGPWRTWSVACAPPLRLRPRSGPRRRTPPWGHHQSRTSGASSTTQPSCCGAPPPAPPPWRPRRRRRGRSAASCAT